MNKLIIGCVLLSLLSIGGIIALLRTPGTTQTQLTGMGTNVTVADGKQLIQITAKGGYLPRVTIAKANMPVVINVVTNGTYDCSSALAIAAVGFRQNLPASGVTPIEIPPQKPGTTINGVCTMGMYNFAVKFN